MTRPGMNPRADPTKPLRGRDRSRTGSVGGVRVVVAAGHPRRGAGTSPTIGDREPRRKLPGRERCPEDARPLLGRGGTKPGAAVVSGRWY